MLNVNWVVISRCSTPHSIPYNKSLTIVFPLLSKAGAIRYLVWEHWGKAVGLHSFWFEILDWEVTSHKAVWTVPRRKCNNCWPKRCISHNATWEDVKTFSFFITFMLIPFQQTSPNIMCPAMYHSHYMGRALRQYLTGHTRSFTLQLCAIYIVFSDQVCHL